MVNLITQEKTCSAWVQDAKPDISQLKPSPSNQVIYIPSSLYSPTRIPNDLHGWITLVVYQKFFTSIFLKSAHSRLENKNKARILNIITLSFPGAAGLISECSGQSYGSYATAFTERFGDVICCIKMSLRNYFQTLWFLTITSQQDQYWLLIAEVRYSLHNSRLSVFAFLWPYRGMTWPFVPQSIFKKKFW